MGLWHQNPLIVCIQTRLRLEKSNNRFDARTVTYGRTHSMWGKGSNLEIRGRCNNSHVFFPRSFSPKTSCRILGLRFTSSSNRPGLEMQGLSLNPQHTRETARRASRRRPWDGRPRTGRRSRRASLCYGPIDSPCARDCSETRREGRAELLRLSPPLECRPQETHRKDTQVQRRPT